MGTSIEGSGNEGIANFYSELYSSSTTDKSEHGLSRTPIMSQVVESLVSLCCSISEYPYVRYSTTHSGPSIVAQGFQVCINKGSCVIDSQNVCTCTPSVLLSLASVYLVLF